MEKMNRGKMTKPPKVVTLLIMGDLPHSPIIRLPVTQLANCPPRPPGDSGTIGEHTGLPTAGQMSGAACFPHKHLACFSESVTRLASEGFPGAVRARRVSEHQAYVPLPPLPSLPPPPVGTSAVTGGASAAVVTNKAPETAVRLSRWPSLSRV